MKNKNVLFLTQAAMIAALYIVLTALANALGLASGNIQVRFSEALTVLPLFTASAVPGLYVGCVLANIITGAALPDIVFGPIATLIGALGTWYIGILSRKAASKPVSGKLSLYEWLAPVPSIVANGAIIPFVLKYAYGIIPVWFSAVTVTAGEIISCGIFGWILILALRRYRSQLFPNN